MTAAGHLNPYWLGAGVGTASRPDAPSRWLLPTITRRSHPDARRHSLPRRTHPPRGPRPHATRPPRSVTHPPRAPASPTAALAAATATSQGTAHGATDSVDGGGGVAWPREPTRCATSHASLCSYPGRGGTAYSTAGSRHVLAESRPWKGLLPVVERRPPRDGRTSWPCEAPLRFCLPGPWHPTLLLLSSGISRPLEQLVGRHPMMLHRKCGSSASI